MESKKRVIPYITPTIALQGGSKEFYHYNAGDDPEMYRKWHEYPREDIVKKVPIQIDIETTTCCNLKCPFCFHSSSPTNPIVGNHDSDHMSFDFYKHVINEFSYKGGTSVKLMYRGDPLVTPNIAEFVKYASDHGLQARFNTNGQLLTQETSEDLIKAGLVQLIFSIDSHIKEEYESIRRPNANKKGNFEKIVENVKRFAEIRNRSGSKYPIIEVSRVDIPETRKNLPEFQGFWLANGADYVSTVGLNDYSMGKEGKMLVSSEFCCEMPWQRMFVLTDGRATACCGDLYQQYPYAQLATPQQINNWKQNLEEIANNHSPGDKIEYTFLSEEKLGKTVTGKINTDSSVEITGMRIRGITGITTKVPISTSIEEVWNGKLASHMREVNRIGEAHKIRACADCGYRETTIRKINLPHTIEDRPKSSNSGKPLYEKEGIKMSK